MKHDSHVPELLTVTGQKDSSGIRAAAETNASLILDGTTKQINKVLYVLCCLMHILFWVLQCYITATTDSYLPPAEAVALWK